MVKDSLVVRTAARAILPLLMLLSVFLLLRGHNAPGGGFIGGLVAAVAIILLAMAGGLGYAEMVLPKEKAPKLMVVGLAMAIVAAVTPWFTGAPFLKGLWPGLNIPGIGEIGTPLIFDIGVYLVVVGMALTVVLRLVEKVEQWRL